MKPVHCITLCKKALKRQFACSSLPWLSSCVSLGRGISFDGVGYCMTQAQQQAQAQGPAQAQAAPAAAQPPAAPQAAPAPAQQAPAESAQASAPTPPPTAGS